MQCKCLNSYYTCNYSEQFMHPIILDDILTLFLHFIFFKIYFLLSPSFFNFNILKNISIIKTNFYHNFVYKFKKNIGYILYIYMNFLITKLHVQVLTQILHLLFIYFFVCLLIIYSFGFIQR